MLASISTKKPSTLSHPGETAEGPLLGGRYLQVLTPFSSLAPSLEEKVSLIHCSIIDNSQGMKAT